jgi:hypothetical protein
MVNDGGEDGHMMYLLSECGLSAEDRFESYKFKRM